MLEQCWRKRVYSVMCSNRQFYTVYKYYKTSSKHIKGSKECYLFGQDTTCKFLVCSQTKIFRSCFRMLAVILVSDFCKTSCCHQWSCQCLDGSFTFRTPVCLPTGVSQWTGQGWFHASPLGSSRRSHGLSGSFAGRA